MSSRNAESVAEDVREAVRLALKHWDATSLAAVAESQARLEKAVADLQDLQAAIAAGKVSGAEANEALNGTCLLTGNFLRVVDACTAFVSGISGLTADTGLFYDASGAIRPNGLEPVPGAGEDAWRVS